MKLNQNQNILFYSFYILNCKNMAPASKDLKLQRNRTGDAFKGCGKYDFYNILAVLHEKHWVLSGTEHQIAEKQL